MAEILNLILSGRACFLCGIYFRRDHGYPVLCKGCFEEAAQNRPEDQDPDTPLTLHEEL